MRRHPDGKKCKVRNTLVHNVFLRKLDIIDEFPMRVETTPGEGGPGTC